MKVLFCTDGSEISLFAIEKALTLIKKDFVIDIVNVMETGLLNTFVTFPHDVEVGFPEEKNISEKIMEETANFIESKGFKAGEKIQLNGHPAEMIIDFIYEKNNYSAVILGSHGKKGFKRWLGSISKKIAYKSPIPIFIVKPLNNNQISENQGEILIAVDGSQNSYNAVKKTQEIIDFKEHSVEILTVKSSEEDLPVEIKQDKEWLNKCIKKQDEITNEILDKTSAILEENNIKPSKKTILKGDAAEEILKYTENNKKDIIIMGSHGKEGLSHLILGSVSTVVLDHANTSVLIIQNKPEKK